MFAKHAIRCAALAVAGLLALACHAQQSPLTGRMLAADRATPATSTVPSPSNLPIATEAEVGDEDHLGDATRALLQVQTNGSQAGPVLPMLGDQASASYRRYLRSFDHDIPEFFDAKVQQDGASTR
jgi:hypothetical protein